jgi:hypothetical protein
MIQVVRGLERLSSRVACIQLDRRLAGKPRTPDRRSGASKRCANEIQGDSE